MARVTLPFLSRTEHGSSVSSRIESAEARFFLPTLKNLIKSFASSRNRININASYLILNTANLFLTGFLFWLLAARLYNPEAVGLAAAAFSVATLIGIVTNLGMGYGLVRFIPNSGTGESHLINWGLTVATLASLIAAAIFMAGVPWWSPSLGVLRENILVSLFSVIFIVLLAIHEIQTLIFLAYRRTEFVLVKNLGFALLRILLVVTFAGAIQDLGVLYAMGTSYFWVVVTTSLVLIRMVCVGYRPKFTLSKPPSMDFVWFSLSNATSNFVLLLPTTLLPVIVIAILGAENNAYFYVAWSIGILLTSLPTAFSLSLFAEGSFDSKELGATVRRVVPFAGLVTGLGTIVILAFGDKLLLVYGPKYSEEGTALLRLMAVAALPAIGSNIYVAILRVRKQNHHYIGAVGVLAATTLGLGYLLLQHWGIAGLGVAWISGHSLVMAIAVIHLIVNRRHGRVTARAVP